MDMTMTGNRNGSLSMLNVLGEQARMLTENITTNLFQLGHVFIQAKALVAHGEWGKWLQENSGMSERAAQNCMAAYQRYGSDPRVKGLEKTQIFRLLSLPDGTEDRFFEDHDVQRMNSREIEAAVKTVREEMGLEVQRVRENAEREARIREKDFERRIRDAGDEARKDIECERARADDLAGRLEASERNRAELENTVVQLRDSVESSRSLQACATEKINEAEKIADERVRKALEELARAEHRATEAEKETKELEELLRESQEEVRAARDDALNLKSAMARGDAERTVSGDVSASEFSAVITGFLMNAGPVVYMGKQFAVMDPEERKIYEDCIGKIVQWAEDAKRALGTVHGGDSYVF